MTQKRTPVYNCDKKEVCTHVSELDQAHLPELANAVVRWSGLQEELCQAHLLTPEAWAHLTAARGVGG